MKAPTVRTDITTHRETLTLTVTSNELCRCCVGLSMFQLLGLVAGTVVARDGGYSKAFRFQAAINSLLIRYRQDRGYR